MEEMEKDVSNIGWICCDILDKLAKLATCVKTNNDRAIPYGNEDIVFFLSQT